MVDLATHSDNGSIFLKDIAKRMQVSEKYLGILVLSLKNAGLVHSTRGAHGGYSLARDPSEISMKEIVQSLEGSIGLVKCVDNPDTCSKSIHCAAREIWEESSRAMEKVLEKKSLADLAERKKALNSAGPLYFI